MPSIWRTPRFAEHQFRKNLHRRNRAADPVQRARLNDLLHEEKVAIDEFVARTRNEIVQQQFRPEQYTDPRGARLFTLLPVYSLQNRYIQLNLTALSKIIRTTRIRTRVQPDETMNDLCWELFNMQHIRFSERNQLEGKPDSDKSFTGAIRTDGIALEFICERPVLAAEIPLTPTEIAERIDLNTATIWGLDPGLHDIFVASDGAVAGVEDVAQRHRIRKTSTAEYYQLAGFKSATIKRTKHDRNNRDARLIISQHSLFEDKQFRYLQPCCSLCMS